MTGTTITPPFWGVVLGIAVVMAALFYGAWRDEVKADRTDPRRTARIADSEIDHTYVSGGE